MSFSSEAKAELCRVETPHDCCRAAECYGLLGEGKPHFPFLCRERISGSVFCMPFPTVRQN